MASKSRYHIEDRGSKTRPLWSVIDNQKGGIVIYQDRNRSMAQGYMMCCRRLDVVKANSPTRAAD